MRRTIPFVILVLAPACSGLPGTPEFSRERSGVVYGEDDREELADAPEWQQLFQQSVFALIPGARLAAAENGRVALNSMPLEEKYSLCPGAAFGAQPTAAVCAGVLIAEDLVLTAGHCFFDDSRCDQFAYVAGYAESDGEVTLAAEDVYGCRDILARRLDQANGTQLIDYAIVELDRPARGQPVVVDETQPALGQALTMLGFPNGLPVKVDPGGQVTDNAAADHFQATFDAFGASSGSPVFDEAAVLRGILVAGAPYDYADVDGCWEPREVGAEEIALHGTERVVLAGPALSALEAVPARARPVRCTGLDCTRNSVDDVQIMSPPAPAALAPAAGPTPGGLPARATPGEASCSVSHARASGTMRWPGWLLLALTCFARGGSRRRVARGAAHTASSAT